MSAGNILTTAGVMFGASTFSVLGTAIIARAMHVEDGFNGFLAGLPLWIPITAFVLSVLTAMAGGLVQALSQIRSFEAFEEEAAQRGWSGFVAPRWVFDSRTYPLRPSKKFAVSDAFVGDYQGYWAATMLAENETGVTGARAFGSFQIIGFPFNNDVPRVMLVPKGEADYGAGMDAAKTVVLDNPEFASRWIVKAEDADAARAMIHASTQAVLGSDLGEKLPVVIDGGAIWTWTATTRVGRELDSAMDLLLTVARAIPREVLDRTQAELLPVRSDNLHNDWVLSRRAKGIEQRDQWDVVDEPEPSA